MAATAAMLLGVGGSVVATGSARHPRGFQELTASYLPVGDATHPDRPTEYTDRWAVVIAPGPHSPDEIAAQHNFENIGQIGSLLGHYHFVHGCGGNRTRHRVDNRGCLSRQTRSDHHTVALATHAQVVSAEQQVKLHRDRRRFVAFPDDAMGPAVSHVDHEAHAHGVLGRRSVDPTDPEWSRQWYLDSGGAVDPDGHRKDIQVRKTWDAGFTGTGVVVTIVDDGMEHDHPDLVDNYDPAASTDMNGGDDDPYPDERHPINKHGTRCSGEVGGAMNTNCGIGVAFTASIGAVRMLDGDVTDSVEAGALSLNPNHIDIYTSSWGPNDDGRTIEGPAARTQQVLIDGVTSGRNGKGSLYLFASGNGGSKGDSCNCDGYCNSVYTMAIGAVSENAHKPYYTEPCAATLAVTYSSGSGSERMITTTDLHNGCTRTFSGTSAAAPLAAGILALTLQARPELTWRDVQHLVVLTALRCDKKDTGWHQNHAGLWFNLKYGFGKMDAFLLTDAATRHRLVGPQLIDTFSSGKGWTPTTAITHRSLSIGPADSRITRLEHVQVHVDIDCHKRGQLILNVVCPSGTVSNLLTTRSRDNTDLPLKWTFMTVECWNEPPTGTWKLQAKVNNGATAEIKSWSITIRGTGELPALVTNPPPVDEEFGDDCRACDEGSYAYVSGKSCADATSCQTCPVGFRCPGGNTGMGIPCSPGSYQDSVSQTVCQSCPANQTQPTAGQASCLPCRPSQVSDGGADHCHAPGATGKSASAISHEDQVKIAGIAIGTATALLVILLVILVARRLWNWNYGSGQFYAGMANRFVIDDLEDSDEDESKMDEAEEALGMHETAVSVMSGLKQALADTAPSDTAPVAPPLYAGIPASTGEESVLDQSDLLFIPGIDSSAIAATVDTSDVAFEAAFSEI